MKELVNMTALTKYRKYGVFPHKIFLQISLLLVTIMQVTQVIQPNTNYQAFVAKFFLN